MEKQNGRRSFLKYLFSLSAFIAGSILSSNKNRRCIGSKISRAEAQGMAGTGKRVKKIAVEEHCFTKTYVDWLYSSRTGWDSTPPNRELGKRYVTLERGELKTWMKLA